jgi:spermidine/putrescine transport system permease protein
VSVLRKWVPRATLLGPGVAYWTLLFVAPIGLLLAYSFLQRGPFGGVVFTFTFGNYVRAVDPLFIKVLLTSVRIAATATVVALLIGYPAALFIARVSPRWRVPLLFLVILPFWTSFLIRTYAWMVLLAPVGLINKLLIATGLIDSPLSLLYNEFAIVVGLVYSYIPLMILPLFASLERLGSAPQEAAADLYASPFRVLRTVTLPLTLPGIVAGCIFVFVPSLGNFIVPELLGGGRKIMIGNVIQQQFLQARDWPFGAVLAVVLVFIMLILLGLQAQVLRRQQAGEP